MQRIRTAWLWSGAAALAAALSVLLLDRIFPPPELAARSIVVTDARGQMFRAFPVEDGRWRLGADLEEIDPAFIEALIAIEDERFYRHHGVDPVAIMRASVNALRAGEIVSGASTLTMQTARLLEPRPERNLGSKLMEAWRALQLEARHSKAEILETYLTLTPYGGNLEGITSASWAWFGHAPDRLTPAQIALLISLPQAPEARRPDLRPDNARAGRARILDRLARYGLIADDIAAESADEMIPSRHDFPSLAWHASDFLRQGTPGETRIVSTLDYNLQTEAERLAAEAAASVEPDVQIAILIVENESLAVRAAVGSASRARAGGWIDLTTRPRSPGSTLKPFIYGMAFDDGIATPHTRITDAPRRFDSYMPENFDRVFRGDVTVAEALQHSLNVPAVETLDAVGASRFAAGLRFAGTAPAIADRAETETGLAIALGGAGLSVRDLATLYAGLANGGEVRPLVWTQDDTAGEAPGMQILSEESAGEILTILRGAPQPAGRAPASLTSEAPAIAFKTGTSWGYRDAWAAGVGAGHTVIVWVGRADARPRTGQTGREAALPILFDVFDLLPRQETPREEREPWRLAQETPAPLEHYRRDPAPEILFPPDEAEVWMDHDTRGYILAGRGETALTWYVDGQPVPLNPAGEPVWTPEGPGFYAVRAVDEYGRSSRSRVRIITSQG
ncbi:penicillin-binding protein 1C [Hyphobacterium sp. HN65]|uniref:peptidoglycan glycosyltransferase n=1 Tax=Hyphobacterium lacteum TaxID=3116575 RepID=A0ABU7LNU9_9PROT|nr:penicillin-binding protein 1C [Hyphobacterium sp. HN65]MEE2525585.1 penicillin-binding protein 1C [Hyphobacterium sp. HN65]